jgi:hypothetical protein
MMLLLERAAAFDTACFLTITVAGAPDSVGGMTWEYAGGYNLGRDFDSEFGLF